jgi:prevent-host-death family protein
MTIVICEVTMSKAAVRKKPHPRVRPAERTIAAGEFKAMCLRIMDEVNETGLSLVVTKRGQPVMRVVPFMGGKKNSKRKDSIFGRLIGVMEIVGDPEGLIKPVFALEDYDMLK